MKRLFTLTLILTAFFNLAFSQIFYKIEKEGNKPSYILGSHHLAPLSNILSIEGVQEAFENTAQVVGEVDMTVGQMAMAMEMQPFMMAPADSTLSKVIPANDLARISVEFAKYAPMPGMELSMLEPMKPVVITNMVTVGVFKSKMPDFNPEEQIDMYFQQKGKEKGKKVVGLESVKQQAEILYNFYPISKQAESLIELLDKPDEIVEQATKLNKSYAEHDIESLLKLSEESDSDAAFMERLLLQRNNDWLTRLPGILDAEPTFVVVGALHLPGEKGVLEGLRKAGYKITPIK